jgi:amino acid adenylation domain-containing protein
MSANLDMHEPQTLLAHLHRAGAKVWLDDDCNIRLQAPRGVLDDALKKVLARHKPALIVLLRQRDALQPDPARRFEPFPLTDIQRAYWVGRQQAFELGDVSIHFYTEIDCSHLDIARLEHAWNRVVHRHDMLRAIVRDDGEQQVLEEVTEHRIVVHACAGDAAALQSIRERLSHSRRTPDRWPGFAIEVALLDADHSRLHISIDLLHVDGASLHVVFADWARYYRDPQAQLPPIALGYRDYVLAELAQQRSARYAEDLAYWRQQVTELPPAPRLPLTNATTGTFARRAFVIDEITFQRLRRRASALGVTPTMFVLAAFAEIIRHWSRDPSFTLNVTLFNRLPVHPQVHTLVGDFTSMLLLAVDHRADETLACKAVRLQQRLWEHLDHRSVSGVKVLGELNAHHKERAASIMPVVFTSLLDLKGQGFSTEWLEAFGERRYTLTQTPQVYLDHQVRELSDGGLECSWDVIEDMFPSGLVDAMLGAYETLLHALIADESAWNATAACHTSPAQLAQRAAANETARAWEDDRATLRSLFIARAATDPQAVALVHADACLSYGELSAAANALGAELEELGAAPERVVAIIMEKGWEQIVAALGVHAAGAAYLPIDAEQPQARIDYLLKNSGAFAVITQPHLRERVALPAHVPAVVLDAPWLQQARSWSAPARDLCAPEHLSHVIYTSGSTGKPKGVMVEHRNVVNRVLDINERYGVGASDKVLALTALHHDLSVYDIFGVLAAGGQVIVPEASQRRDPAHWLDLLTTHEITLWNSVPAFLEMLLDYQEEGGARVARLPGSLRFAILAGDWIPLSLPSRVRAQRPQLQFVASGGPTETTIWDIYYHVTDVDPAWRSIPYGKPLANARYHVLNALLQPCPTWVPGELYIGGAGVTRGYLGDAQKTAAQFMTHPLTGERLYRSGDLGRYLPDGNIEFLGREDFQVKIRGQRIELAEIEAAARQHADVRQALAKVHENAHGKRLTLYVVPDGDAVSDYDVRADHAAGVDDEARDFIAAGAAISDPAERLLFKLRQAHGPSQAHESTVALSRVAASRGWKSHRRYAQAPIPFERFAALLGLWSAHHEGEAAQHTYGSAGGLYPVRAYASVKAGRVAGVDAGLYAYDPHAHTLQFVSGLELDPEPHYTHNRTTVEAAAFALYLIGDLDAITPLYGELGRDMCLLEAGAMCQLMRTHAAEYGIGVCQIGHFQFAAIASEFRLAANQILLATLVGGGLHPANSSTPVALATFKERLAAHLANQLPQHMTPAQIVVMQALPLTANGKVDRAALPDPAASAAVCETASPPANDLEALIAAVWQDVLGCAQVNVQQNFFDLGANSALIVKAYQRLCDRLGRKFPLITMFRHPTTRALAAHITDAASDAEAAVSAARAEKRKQRLRRASRIEDPTA